MKTFYTGFVTDILQNFAEMSCAYCDSYDLVMLSSLQRSVNKSVVTLLAMLVACSCYC